MSGEQGAPTGPDLAAGVSLAELAEGKPLVGHAGDEAVMVVRRGDQIFAVGATCTHYGGPLAEGSISDEGDVRCPWHHACFSLRTGEALRAPALNPIACYEVERQGDLVRVGAKRAASAGADAGHPKPATSASTTAVVIVGAGAAGHAAAEMLRRQGHTGSITMISADADPPYDRPNLSKDYLAGTAPEEWIPLRPREFYAEHHIDLQLGVSVTAIDTKRRQIGLSDGRSMAWEALLLATGAEPVRLPVPGADRFHVHTLRSLADSRAIIAHAAGAKRAVVVGGSFIGLEAAASLRARGLDVQLVAPEPRPLERTLGPEVGDFVRGLHEQKGVVFHLEKSVKEIGETSVTLASGETLPADLVVVGIGVRPALGLAESAGLAVDRGVLVNAFMETNFPGVYAAGDLARWPDPVTGERVRIEHWVVAQRMGQTAARNILGARQALTAAPFFWSVHYDVTLSYVGHAERWDRIDRHGNLAARDCTLAYRAGDKTLAVLTVGRDAVSLAAEVAFERRDEAALQTFGRKR
jgi:NADPH-dependent 2,4-dienoyl-CoA reductase/sulfur reductase-like enzyme/nitrite reductase/ring-hydroxylating ferredoxin subunit